jgi:hypothetical protein
MPILYVKERDNTYQHTKVVFSNLGIVVDFGPKGDKNPWSLTQAPGEVKISKYTPSKNDEATKIIEATPEEEKVALGAVKVWIGKHWKHKQYDALSDNCMTFAWEVMGVSATKLNRSGRQISKRMAFVEEDYT